MSEGTEKKDEAPVKEESAPERTRREFMQKFGAYAAGSALGVYVLMSPKTSKALGPGSDGGG